MIDLMLTSNTFNPNPYWDVPLDRNTVIPYQTPDLFDQNGYDLCSTEQMYAVKNHRSPEAHRPHRAAIRQTWIKQHYKQEGAVLNHGLLFERKGYSGQALQQLKEWADFFPAYYRLINIKPKWGLDFSIDYYDRDGNTLEILHWEYDGFNYDEINDIKEAVEQRLVSIDWDDAGKKMLALKEEWYKLDFFAQSEYKCKYFGIAPERWKMVVWE